jgi:hypothetical protein
MEPVARRLDGSCLRGLQRFPRLHHADISRAAVQVLREYTGHGPTNARIGALRAQVRPLWSVWTAGVRISVAHAKARKRGVPVLGRGGGLLRRARRWLRRRRAQPVHTAISIPASTRDGRSAPDRDGGPRSPGSTSRRTSHATGRRTRRRAPHAVRRRGTPGRRSPAHDARPSPRPQCVAGPVGARPQPLVGVGDLDEVDICGAPGASGHGPWPPCPAIRT